MKFKVGDEVLYSSALSDAYKFSEYDGGNKGVVDKLEPGVPYPYTVKFHFEGGKYHLLVCAENELELVE